MISTRRRAYIRVNGGIIPFHLEVSTSVSLPTDRDNKSDFIYKVWGRVCNMFDPVKNGLLLGTHACSPGHKLSRQPLKSRQWAQRRILRVCVFKFTLVFKIYEHNTRVTYKTRHVVFLSSRKQKCLSWFICSMFLSRLLKTAVCCVTVG